jgi:seipin
LFGIAIIAYTSFYVAYIPVRGISIPVHLQYDTAGRWHKESNEVVGIERRFPYGIAEVKGLVARQKYDVVIQVHLPRSRRNLGAGNWMVGVEMRGPSTVENKGEERGLLGWEGEDDFWSDSNLRSGQTSSSERTAIGKPAVLARSTRPAIITYRSFFTESLHRFLRLPLYTLGWRTESETVTIPVMDNVEFDKGYRNIPTSLRLEVRSSTPLEIYRVGVNFVARLEGLRWIMYEYRLASFVVFTALFWGTEMAVLMFTWAAFTLLFGSRSTDDAQVKQEKLRIKIDPDAPPRTPNSTAPSTPRSDTSRTFPTLSSQQPLHYSSGEGKVKREREETLGMERVPIKTEAEADDEDEDEDFFLEEPVPASAVGAVQTDSGIGTSMESSVEGRGLVRKRSKGGSREM